MDVSIGLLLFFSIAFHEILFVVAVFVCSSGPWRMLAWTSFSYPSAKKMTIFPTQSGMQCDSLHTTTVTKRRATTLANYMLAKMQKWSIKELVAQRVSSFLRHYPGLVCVSLCLHPSIYLLPFLEQHSSPEDEKHLREMSRRDVVDQDLFNARHQGRPRICDFEFKHPIVFWYSSSLVAGTKRTRGGRYYSGNVDYF